jgi:Arc/MetJ-type ribon-helix-helix transcriptional regulator
VHALVQSSGIWLRRGIVDMAVKQYDCAMTTITCKIPTQLDAAIETAARRKKLSKSEVIRQALRAGLPKHTRLAAASAYDLAKHLAGSVKGGARDVSHNPKHLEKFDVSRR